MCTNMNCPHPVQVQILFLNLTQECILSLCPLYLTLLWTLLHSIYIESGPRRVIVSFFQLCNGFAHSSQGSSINLNVQHFTHSFDRLSIP